MTRVLRSASCLFGLLCACGGAGAPGSSPMVSAGSRAVAAAPAAGAGSAAGSGGAPAAVSGTGGRAGQAAAPVSPRPAGSPSSAAPPAAGSSSGAPAPAPAPAPEPADPSAELYDEQRVPRFDLELSTAAMEALRADPDTYVRGTLRYGDERVTEIGVRIKGEGSLRTLDQKPALKLKFDEFVNDQSFRGLRRLTLNNMVEDPSFIAERLAYLVYRTAKLPAPRSNNAIVYINDKAYGVYANVETEDKTFLRRWFASDAGNLYEEGQKDFVPGAETTFDLETNETANDRSDLRALIDAVQKPNSQTPLEDWSAALDVDHFLKFSAAEAAVNQWDMYAYTLFWPNNFRLYHDPDSDKFVFLPWGMDMAMKPFSETGRAHIAIFGLARSWDGANAKITAGLMFQRCVANSACKARYTTAVRDMLAHYESLQLEAVAARYYAQIKDHVYADPRKEYTNREFDLGYESVRSTIRTRPAAIRADLGK